jgi:hypothetical protein
MTISTIDESQRKAARVAGFTYLVTVAIVVFEYHGWAMRVSVFETKFASPRRR